MTEQNTPATPEQPKPVKANDDMLLQMEGFKHSPYVSFNNKEFKDALGKMEKAFLSGKDIPDMITNLMFAMLEAPLDVLNGYFKHLKAQETERKKALQGARKNWDAEQMKEKGLTTAGLMGILTQSAKETNKNIREKLEKEQPDFYNSLPKDKDGNILFPECNKEQKKFIQGYSYNTINDTVRKVLEQTLNRTIGKDEILVDMVMTPFKKARSSIYDIRARKTEAENAAGAATTNTAEAKTANAAGAATANTAGAAAKTLNVNTR